jgi:hypothetical protein
LCNWFFRRDIIMTVLYHSLASSKSSRSCLSVSYSPWTLHRVFPPISTPIVVVSDIRFALAGQYRIWTRLYLCSQTPRGEKQPTQQKKRPWPIEMATERNTHSGCKESAQSGRHSGFQRISPWSPKFE